MEGSNDDKEENGEKITVNKVSEKSRLIRDELIPLYNF